MQCDHACFNPCALRVHLKTHSGEKLNKCSQCDFASSRAVNLRKHLITHRGEKQNKCNQCDYAFSQASNLRTHLKTHSGENSNKCPESKCTTTNMFLSFRRTAISCCNCLDILAAKSVECKT